MHLQTPHSQEERERCVFDWVTQHCASCLRQTSLFILTDANARIGVRTGEEEGKIVGAYGRDSRVSDGNDLVLIQFAGDNKPALVNTLLSIPKGNASRTFISAANRPADKKPIDYILTRQDYCRLARNVTIHLQPPYSPDFDHNIVCASVRLLGSFAYNRPG